MNKYCVHMGVRLTKDFYIIAHDENEAEEMAQSLFETTDYSDMSYADSDSDIWEEEFDDDMADDIAEDDD